MLRVVLEHSPALYTILGRVDEADLVPVIVVNDSTYYLATRKVHYALYRAALTGWGQGPDLNPMQR